ncbi:MAG: hypothetical protein IPG96_00905 [Proteobacteria bacterium]|nr:hypothetical protein [Pseudomonadota bacterium]
MDVSRAIVLLRQRSALRRDERERRAAEVQRVVAQAVRRVVPPQSRVWLIGSLAWGGFGEHSDVDLVVENLPSELMLALERAIVAAADARVDLLELGALPEGFRQRVETEGVLLCGT